MNNQITEQQISDIISELSTEHIITPVSFSETMESEEANSIFNYIERELNTLYDRIRLLEQLNTYTKVYVSQQIEDKEQKFKEYLKTIEDVSDLYQDTNTVSYSAQFLASKDTIRDRDGSLLTQMDIINHKIEMPGTILHRANINNIVHTSSVDCYNNNYNNLLNNQPGTSIYYSDIPITGGILEHNQVSLTESGIYNYIAVNTTNASISNAKLLHEPDDTVIDISHAYINPTLMSGISFDLLCTAYHAGKKVNTNSDAKTTIPIDGTPSTDGTNKNREEQYNWWQQTEQIKEGINVAKETNTYIYRVTKPSDRLRRTVTVYRLLSDGTYEPLGSYVSWDDSIQSIATQINSINPSLIRNKEKENYVIDNHDVYKIMKGIQ